MKDFKIYIGIASLLLILYISFEYNKPQPVNWQPTLYYGDKIPFGTYIFYHQLADVFPGSKVINTHRSLYSEFKSDSIRKGNYIVISRTAYVTKADLKAMGNYMESGNSVFISAFAWVGFLADSLKIETKSHFSKKSTLYFTNSNLQRTGGYQFDKGVGMLYFSQFDSTKAAVISKNNYNNATLISFKFGKGKLYLCADPEIFTNYSLLKPQSADYAAKALSYLPVTRNIYWDEYQNHDIAEEESPMRVFFKYPALQWAYYLSLFSLLLFLVFEVKRRQRIIPIIEPLKNASLEFVNVVGQVYYENRDNANIAYKKITFLFSYLRDRYNLKTNKLDSEFIDTLVNKAGVEPGFARELVNHINYLGVQTRVSDHELILLNQMIEKFYIRS